MYTPGNSINTFDVMIVYSEGQSISASSGAKNTTPFAIGSRNENYNLVYSYFLEVCKKNKLKAAFTTSCDIIGAGLCSSFWLYKNNSWVKVTEIGFSKVIFDKLSPTRKVLAVSRDLLFSSAGVLPFNNQEFHNLCFDKQKTHDKLKSFSIPTVPLESNNAKGIRTAITMLNQRVKRHKCVNDFGDQVVIKNRFGSGGRSVYKFDSKNIKGIAEKLRGCQKMSFIVQPFVHFDKGFKFQGSPTAADVRLIYLGKKFVQTYVRIPKPGNFICNEHKGGTLNYISKSQVPQKVVKVAENITHVLGENPSLYSLDFIISNSGSVYLLEANTGPGLDWNLSKRKNEREAKKLIRMIVDNLAKRVKKSKQVKKKGVVPVSIPISPILQVI